MEQVLIPSLCLSLKKVGVFLLYQNRILESTKNWNLDLLENLGLFLRKS